jgi:hypothetical protein
VTILITCDYCYRPAVAKIWLKRGVFRAVFGLPRLERLVCAKHMRRRG